MPGLLVAGKRAVRALHEPWLDAPERHFQELVQEAGKLGSSPIVGERDVCVLFIDGLRFDVGAALAAELEQRGVIAKLVPRVLPCNPSVLAGTEVQARFRH